MKSIVIVIALAVVGIIFYIGDNVLHQSHPASTQAPIVAAPVQVTATTLPKPQVTPAAVSLPKPPLYCSTNASLIQLSSDYVISGMNCVPSGGASQNPVLVCSGDIVRGATKVRIECSTPRTTTANSTNVSCTGGASTGGSANLAVHYQCYPASELSTTSVYSCAGDIANYRSYAINLAMSVNCVS